MPRFLLTILVIIGVYYGLRYLFRLLLPVLLKYWMKKMTGGQFHDFQDFSRTNQSRKEGDVTINDDRRKRSKKNTDGDYVDYEEMKKG
jgi:hypothetical protein